MTRPIAASILTACLLTAAAAPVTAEPPASKNAPAPADKAVLRGPGVTETPAAPSLVQRDFAGRIVELDMHPAEAAVRLLDLDKATAAKVDTILLERSAMLDKLVADNLELLVRLQGARESGDTQQTAALFQQLSAKAQPLRDRGQLAQELMTVLNNDQDAELRRLMQEYWRAVVKQELDDKRAAQTMDPDAEPDATAAPSRREQRADTRDAMRQEMQQIIGGEIRRAYERTIGSAAREFDNLIKDLNITPEQESKIRKLVGDSFQRTYGKATAAERTKVFWEVYSVLDDAQKAEVVRRLGSHPPITR